MEDSLIFTNNGSQKGSFPKKNSNNGKTAKINNSQQSNNMKYNEEDEYRVQPS